MEDSSTKYLFNSNIVHDDYRVVQALAEDCSLTFEMFQTAMILFFSRITHHLRDIYANFRRSRPLSPPTRTKPDWNMFGNT